MQEGRVTPKISQSNDGVIGFQNPNKEPKACDQKEADQWKVTLLKQ